MATAIYPPRTAPLRALPFEGIVNAVGFLTLIAAPWWIYQLFFSNHGAPEWFTGSDSPASLGFSALFVAVSGFLVYTFTRQDRWLGPLLLTALMIKLACAAAYLAVAFDMYGRSADMIIYVTAGRRLAHSFDATGALPILHPFWSTAFIQMFTSWIMIIAGESVGAVMVFFSVVAFWGQYLYFRAFRITYPRQSAALPALLIFFLPSIAYWSAAIGKDALMMFAAGLTVYAFARLIADPGPSGVILLLAGLGCCMLVRPHVAAILAISLLVPYLFSKSHRGISAGLVKVMAVPLLLVGLAYLVSQAGTFVDLKEVSDAARVLNKVGINSSYGGSKFGGGQSIAQKLLYAPFLLFRPFPWETNNIQALATSIEGMGLLLLVWRRKRQVKASVMQWRDDSFVFYVLLYVVAMTAMLAGGISNFGLLARQRVMILAPFLLLICREPGALVARAAESPQAPDVDEYRLRGSHWPARTPPGT